MKILIVDDHPVFRDGMVIMMQRLYSDTAIIEAGDMAGLIAGLHGSDMLDLVVLDLVLPGFDMLKDFAQLRKKLALTPIVAVSMIHDNDVIDKIMEAGANGFISKTAHPKDISSSLLSIMNGETLVLRATAPAPTAPADEALTQLTSRQLDVLRFVAKGMSNKEIARELDISPYTVRIHVSAVLRALSLPNRSAAASFAASRGLS